MLTEWKRERRIRKALRSLSRQCVVHILAPGNVWVLDPCPDEGDPYVSESLRTCYLRGWSEIVEDAVPRARLSNAGELPTSLAGVAPVYRLTEAGWAELRRTHELLVATFAASLISAAVAGAALLWMPR